MRPARSERILLAALLLVPLAVALVGWPAFLHWVVGPSAQPTPEVAGAAATPQSGGTQTPARPTATAIPPPVAAQATQVQVRTSEVGPGSADDPSAAVQDFYALVAAHDFERAANLWSPRMQATFPPTQNIDQRFRATRGITVQRAEIVSQSSDQAEVAVELEEAAGDGEHHWSGSWLVVRGPDGWLLDQPRLQAR